MHLSRYSGNPEADLRKFTKKGYTWEKSLFTWISCTSRHKKATLRVQIQVPIEKVVFNKIIVNSVQLFFESSHGKIKKIHVPSLFPKESFAVWKRALTPAQHPPTNRCLSSLHPSHVALAHQRGESAHPQLRRSRDLSALPNRLTTNRERGPTNTHSPSSPSPPYTGAAAAAAAAEALSAVFAARRLLFAGRGAKPIFGPLHIRATASIGQQAFDAMTMAPLPSWLLQHAPGLDYGVFITRAPRACSGCVSGVVPDARACGSAAAVWADVVWLCATRVCRGMPSTRDSNSRVVGVCWIGNLAYTCCSRITRLPGVKSWTYVSRMITWIQGHRTVPIFWSKLPGCEIIKILLFFLYCMYNFRSINTLYSCYLRYF